MQSEGEEGIEMGFSRFSGLERMRGSGGGGGGGGVSQPPCPQNFFFFFYEYEIYTFGPV